MTHTTQVIVRQGWVSTSVLLVALALSIYFGWGFCALLFFIALVCCLYMFRNPERVREDSEDAFVSPVDGVVRDIRYEDSRIVIAVETRVFDVGVIRMPCDSVQSRVSRLEGLTLAFPPKKIQNVLNASMHFENLQGKRFVMEFFPSFFASHNIWSASQSLRMGERIGFMKSGMTYISLPQSDGNLELDLKIDIGDRIYALQSPIGYFK